MDKSPQLEGGFDCRTPPCTFNISGNKNGEQEQEWGTRMGNTFAPPVYFPWLTGGVACHKYATSCHSLVCRLPYTQGMEKTATQILESLDVVEISRRLDEIEHEREALRVLYRAAVRLDRQQRPTADSSKTSPSAGEVRP